MVLGQQHARVHVSNIVPVKIDVSLAILLSYFIMFDCAPLFRALKLVHAVDVQSIVSALMTRSKQLVRDGAHIVGERSVRCPEPTGTRVICQPKVQNVYLLDVTVPGLVGEASVGQLRDGAGAIQESTVSLLLGALI